MCVAIAKPRGASVPGGKALSNCEWSNRDGVGIAWAVGGKVRIKKDFETLDAFKAWLGENITSETPCLIHFRQATSGGVSTGMRHPFPVTSDEAHLVNTDTECDVALIHNGVLWSMSDKDKLSDTAMFVKTILSDPAVIGSVRDNETIQTLISGMIGSSNKLALLWGDGYILTFGEFQTDHGVMYSNGQYKTFEYSRGHYSNETEYPLLGMDFTRRGKWDYCGMCYLQFPKRYMLKDTRIGARDDDKICQKCHKIYNDKRKSMDHKTDDGSKDVLMRCEICQEWFDHSLLRMMSIPDLCGNNSRVDTQGLVCCDCELEMSDPTIYPHGEC